MSSHINTGEYYLLQYSYFHNQEITYGSHYFRLNIDRESILERVKWYYETYKQYDIVMELLKVKAERMPLEIKPVHVEISLDI